MDTIKQKRVFLNTSKLLMVLVLEVKFGKEGMTSEKKLTEFASLGS